jgi:hypothetical protein
MLRLYRVAATLFLLPFLCSFCIFCSSVFFLPFVLFPRQLKLMAIGRMGLKPGEAVRFYCEKLCRV